MLTSKRSCQALQQDFIYRNLHSFNQTLPFSYPHPWMMFWQVLLLLRSYSDICALLFLSYSGSISRRLSHLYPFWNNLCTAPTPFLLGQTCDSKSVLICATGMVGPISMSGSNRMSSHLAHLVFVALVLSTVPFLRNLCPILWVLNLIDCTWVNSFRAPQYLARMANAFSSGTYFFSTEVST